MRNMDRILNTISGKRVLVIGDAMLDHYLHGSVHRMSPEAPVPVVTHRAEDFRLGGAANVALNLEGLGIKTQLISVAGPDNPGAHLRELADRQLSASHLLSVEGRVTTTKTRVVDNHQQLLRIDQEIDSPVPESVTDSLLETITAIMDGADSPEALVLSDYNKGLLTPKFTTELVSLAIQRNTKVLVDPKGRNFSKYQGATLVTPNISELEAATGSSLATQDLLESTAKTLREQLKLETLIVTMGPQGLLMVGTNELKRYPALSQEVFDVSGAGDTVLAAITAGLLAELPVGDALKFANLCASKVIQRRGTTAITRELLHAGRPVSPISRMQGERLTDALTHRLRTLSNERRRIVFTNGCFDLLHRGHIELLAFAKSQGDVLIVGLNSDDSVKRLKGEGRPINNEQDRAVMLSALAAVDFVVVFDQDTPLELIKEIRPDVLIKGADYADKLVVGQAEVESWGGEVKLCPLLDGYSTTNQIAELSNREAIETVRQPN